MVGSDPGDLLSRQACLHDALDPLELGTEAGCPGGGEAIRPSAILCRQGLDEPVRFEACKGRVQRPWAERLARQLASGDHDRVTVPRALAQRKQDRQGRLGEPAEAGEVSRQSVVHGWTSVGRRTR